MRSLLDEMISWRIAAELRDRRHDVRGGDHDGIIDTHDDTLARNKQAVPLWVATRS